MKTPSGYYGFERRNGKYFVWCNGVRFRVSKETWHELKSNPKESKI